jgi:GNAT superfamily N-acetyltransferase
MSCVLPDFLPGRLLLVPGRVRDYPILERFHYRSKHPSTWAAVWLVVYARGRNAPGEDLAFQTVAMGVLSWPVPFVKARNDHFGISAARTINKIRFINAHVRTISRIIVHPQFRSLGLASLLVRHLCATCPTRYVEALAAMGRAHPLFERAGMRRIEPARPEQPVYYLFDRFSHT